MSILIHSSRSYNSGDSVSLPPESNSSDEGIKDWKILDEEIMFLFCGPGLEPTHTFPVTFCHIVLKWSEAALFGCHEIHASFLGAKTTITILVCHFCSGSLQPTRNLELLNYLKFKKKIACEEHRVLGSWQEILCSRDPQGRTTILLCGQGTGLRFKSYI
jgi:hypothetical protein